ncbi:MAG: hypothetical protein IKK08_12410 [Clostridia bacterium]|nr:hypothetical protein [Clostridia bacterium]
MKKMINLWGFVAFIALVIVLFCLENARIASETQKLKSEYVQSVMTKTELENTYKEKKKELENVQQVPYVERQARDEYDYMDSEEILFLITFPEDENTDPSL